MRNTLLTNKNTNFLNKIIESLGKCTKFYFTVSFIKIAGLNLLSAHIEKALMRGAKGKIITSTYQNFTDIASLEKFRALMCQYDNFDCHIDYNCYGDDGFHTKGYIFEYEEGHEIVIGSSNITRFALLRNIEWNVSLEDSNSFESYQSALIEFDDIWRRTYKLTLDIIKNYKIQLDYAIEKWDMDYISFNKNAIKPNSMQSKALKELRRLRDLGNNKALVISATGSGKTFLAAFDAKNFEAKRLLFVCHRDSILVAARETFLKVFGSTRTYGLYNGNTQDLGCDFIFASNTMLSKHLKDFMRDEFDYIVIDECHHAAASTYKSILEYFNSEFVLGLTATPERMDNENIYELFDENVPFELRLKDAIVNDLIVPFHYYGIRNQLADYSSKLKEIEISREISKDLSMSFVADEINRIKDLENIKGKIKALIFCASISHCNLVSEQLNNLGFNSISLTGIDSTGARIKAFNELQDDNNTLEMICTVDILNEGIDIPGVNMVVFLRPTESQTIFIQQLGRGLRKYINKEYVTVLDFIGNNYDRSVQIAFALGTLGDNAFIEKGYVSDLIRTDFKALNCPGVEIHIDQLSKEEMLSYIKKTNFNNQKFLIKDFMNFKNYLKKEPYPTHLDFLHSEFSPDLMRLMKCKLKNKKTRSYYKFLLGNDIQGVPLFTDEEVELIDTLSEILPLTRPDEYLICKQLLQEELNFDRIINDQFTRVNKQTLDNALHFLKKEKIVTKENHLNVKSISNDLRIYLEDLLQYGIERCQIEFGNFEGKFKLYGNYMKEHVAMELLRKNKMIVKGTEFDLDTKETYVYVGLKKDKDKTERLNYKDKFLSNRLFQWESMKNTTKDNAEGKKILETKVVHLFVRKVDEEDGVTLPFTYFGTGRFTNMRESHVVDIKNGKSNTLLFDIELDNKIDEKYYFDFEIPESEMFS